MTNPTETYPTPEQFSMFSDVYKSYEGIRPRWITKDPDPTITWADLERILNDLEAQANKERQDIIMYNIACTTDFVANPKYDNEKQDPTNPFYQFFKSNPIK